MGPTASKPLLLPTRVRYGVLAFACTLALITYLDRVCISRVQKEIQRDLLITKEDMGWIFTAFLIGYGLFEVPGGWMGDVWGSRRVLFRIVVWWSAFTALTGCVWAYPQAGLALTVMLLVRFLFGAGEAGAFPNLTRVVGVWFPYRERGLATGAIWMSARLGGAIAPVATGALATWLGWREAFWVLGCIGAVWAVAFFFWFRDRPQDMPGCNQAERDLIQADARSPVETPKEPQPAQPAQTSDQYTAAKTEYAAPSRLAELKVDASARGDRSESLPAVPPARPLPSITRDHAWPPLRDLILSPTMWAMGVVSSGVSFGWYFYPTWQPKYLEDVHGISFGQSEILTGLPFLCGAAGCLAGGRLSDFLIRRTGSRRWGRSLIGVIGFTAAGLCVLATGFTTAPWQAVVLLCLAFLVNDLAIPCIWAACADIGGRYVGTVAGIMNTVGAIGGMISPVMIPYVLGDPTQTIPAQRWQIIFIILATAWFLAAAAWLFIDASKPLFPDKRTVSSH